MSEPKIGRGTAVLAGSGVEGWRVAADIDAAMPGWYVMDEDGAAVAYIEGVRLGWARRGEVGR